MADLSVIAGKTLGGDQGDGVLLENIEFRFDKTKEGDDIVEAEITGTAKTYLRDGYNPSAGFESLPEEVPVKDRVKFAGKSTDNKILLDRLNQQFNLQPPLEDNEELWERFTKEGKDSVIDQIVGKRSYFSAKLINGKTGEKANEFYYNLIRVTKREEASMAVVGDRMKALMGKKKSAPSVSFDPND